MSNMPLQTLKSYRIGQIVKIMGREGTIINMAGDEVKIKFDDGSFAFFNVNQVEANIENSSLDSRLKSFNKQAIIAKLCPFCKGESFNIGMAFEQKDAPAFQCMKCSQRFSTEEEKYSYNRSKDLLSNN